LATAPVVDVKDPGVVELGESEVLKLVITGKDVRDTEVLDCVVPEDGLVAVADVSVIVVLGEDDPAAEVLPGIVVLGEVVPTVDIVVLDCDVPAAAEVTDVVLLFEVDARGDDDVICDVAVVTVSEEAFVADAVVFGDIVWTPATVVRVDPGGHGSSAADVGVTVTKQSFNMATQHKQ
jgi:hypothetical protein